MKSKALDMEQGVLMKEVSGTWRKQPRYKLYRRERFDIDSAKLDVWYELYDLRLVGIFKKRWEYRPTVACTAADSGGTYKIYAKGDRFWAKRVAKHYNIEFPEDLKAED